MENLEVLSQESLSATSKTRDKKPAVGKLSESYGGLQLVREERYKGGTSIRYWM